MTKYLIYIDQLFILQKCHTSSKRQGTLCPCKLKHNCCNKEKITFHFVYTTDIHACTMQSTVTILNAM